MQKIRNFLTLPLVVMSAFIPLNAGCNEYETKPIDLPRLLEKIQTLLGQNSQ